ncbi:aminoglycoside phosphotransferase family protein [Flavobacteriaceae bacterium PRS1]|nr:aminoglycoside phosphotransferase family protein [Flavobacteriaceae bacterium PRS1]
MDIQHLKHILNQFKIDTQDVTFQSITTGYINDTFLVLKSEKPLYILQCINSNVFKQVESLMLNIELALAKLQSNEYKTISLLKTIEGKSFYKQNKSYWRLMTFIEGSTTYNTTTNPKVAFEAGRIIGEFHNLLKDESPGVFTDIIPNFNNLPFRITEFKKAIEKVSETRKGVAKNGIDFAIKTHPTFDTFYKAKLPLRICHNDTKLNNILFSKSNEALCLIDLDTIMKGYFHYDFGDAVRTIVNTANEDEIELSKITFNTTLFEAFVDGLSKNASFLTNKEIELLPIATALMPFIHGLRALTDYLNGNIYYKVAYENQNLERCVSLFHFTKLSLQHEAYMSSVINLKLKKQN